jgi:SAM-dependent methyltransferase
MSEIADFYDAWAADYDAAYADWRVAMSVHGTALAAALAGREVAPPARVLDCTCGIGTQAIGLAVAGYSVSGSDISAAEVDRARTEAARLGASARFAVADLLDLDGSLPADWGSYDAVVTANSLTHMADEASLVRVFAQMAGACRPGGVVVVTNRDYDAIADSRPRSTAVQRSVSAGVQRTSFQLWDWAADGRSYRMEDVLLTRPESSSAMEWTVRSRSTTLYAWRRADIDRAAAAAGLVDSEWLTTDWQPIATFRVPT